MRNDLTEENIRYLLEFVSTAARDLVTRIRLLRTATPKYRKLLSGSCIYSLLDSKSV